MFDVLELEVSNGSGGKVQSHRNLITLIDKVPNVYSICLCDENHSGSAWGKGSTCVVGALRVGRSKDRLSLIAHFNVPNRKVKVVNRKNQFGEERTPFKSEDGSVVFLRVIGFFDVLSVLRGLFSRRSLNLRWFDAPVNKHQVSFIRSS